MWRISRTSQTPPSGSPPLFLAAAHVWTFTRKYISFCDAKGEKYIWTGEMMLRGFDGGVRVLTPILISGVKFELCFEFKCSWFNFSRIGINDIQISRKSMIVLPQFSIHWYPAADKRPQAEGGSHCGLVACVNFVVGGARFQRNFIFWNLRFFVHCFLFHSSRWELFCVPQDPVTVHCGYSSFRILKTYRTIFQFKKCCLSFCLAQFCGSVFRVPIILFETWETNKCHFIFCGSLETRSPKHGTM